MDETEQLLKDAQKLQARASTATYLEAKNEFKDNTYPVIVAAIERIAEVEERLAQLEEDAYGQGSVVQADLSDQIMSVFLLTQTFVAAAKTANVLSADLLAQAEALVAATEAVGQQVLTATVEETDPEEDEEGEDEDEDNEDAEDEDGEEDEE